MKNILLLLILPLVINVSGQEIINAVMVDANYRVTRNATAARFIIIVKKHNDSLFERIEYNFAGPRIRSIHYSDPELKSKTDSYLEYSPDGKIMRSGSYKNNLKCGDWHEFDSIRQTSVTRIYENGQLIKDVTGNPRENNSLIGNFKGEEIISDFPGGYKAYNRFLNRNIKYPQRAIQLGKQGTVLLTFTIDTSGKVIDPCVKHSVELSLDEEALRILRIMPLWTPAMQDGRKVRSYKMQPVSFKM